MDECIRRRDAINALGVYLGATSMRAQIAAKAILSPVPAVEVWAEKWTSIKDQLPEPGTNVLILSKSANKGTQTWITVGRYNVNRIAQPERGYWTLYGGDAWSWVPTYWMPLPTPPKEEDQ